MPAADGAARLLLPRYSSSADVVDVGERCGALLQRGKSHHPAGCPKIVHRSPFSSRLPVQRYAIGYDVVAM
jgi:hypothetical protein